MSDKEKAAKWRQYSRSFVSRGWTKLFDPSKHWGVNELVEQEKELKTDDRAESLDQHKCCGGHPCLAAQRRTEDEFRKEMSVVSVLFQKPILTSRIRIVNLLRRTSSRSAWWR